MVLNGDRAADMEMDSDYEPETHDEENKQPKHSFRSVFERKFVPYSSLLLTQYYQDSITLTNDIIITWN